MTARQLLFVGSVLFLTVGGNGTQVLAEPPPWAPAHGYRAKHRYHYSGGEWRVSAQLPGGISLQGRAYTIVDTDSERPYLRQPPLVEKSPSGFHNKHRGKKGKHK